MRKNLTLVLVGDTYKDEDGEEKYDKDDTDKKTTMKMKMKIKTT